MGNYSSISVIVPVFNEEKTVGGVLTSLLSFGSVAEIICVNDGSTDKSGEIVQTFKDRIKIINLTQNRGKGFALVAGLREAGGEVVVFLDSDLFDLTEGHLQQLVSPLLEKRAEATLGAIHNPRLRSFLLPFVGQRAYWRKDLLSHLNNMAKTRYGVEVYLNEAFKKKRVEVVWLKGLGHVIKHKKRGFSETSKEYFIEWLEVSRTLLWNNEKKLGKKMPILNHPRIKTTKDLIRALARVSDKEVLEALKKYFSSLSQHFKG
ncbi:MAG: glycosyltransferase family 2 protein [bacterium]|nr:glycosyltransferase family 2 protein [bacterium]